MEKLSELKGTYRDCRKSKGNKVRHWCILECRDKPTPHCLTTFYAHVNNLIPISIPLKSWYTFYIFLKIKVK